MAVIRFGTDGWRGVIAQEFTFARVAQAAVAAAQVLAQNYGEAAAPILVGYDRRFLSQEFAETVAQAVAQAGFSVLLADQPASTPAFSYGVRHLQAMGALVITASHNPPVYNGLKVKGAFGGSVSPEITQQIEAQLEQAMPQRLGGRIQSFDPWPDYVSALQKQVDVAQIQAGLANWRVWVDVMHGAAAGGLTRILGNCVQELRTQRDVLFGGHPPEPLPAYLQVLQTTLQGHRGNQVGLVFDGDGDRIAAMDGQGNFLSPQVLIPILIQHLAQHRGLSGTVVKTISGSELIAKTAASYNLPVVETPIGFKYIAQEMLAGKVLLGGEESGGIGYGHYLPERDALLSALYLLEAVAVTQKPLEVQYQELQAKTNFVSTYNRIDVHLPGAGAREALLHQLAEQPPTVIAETPVVKTWGGDGYKCYLSDQSWLLIRFSGTEPLLRLYCESLTPERGQAILAWARHWAESSAQ
ncbi:Phosphoglucomutase/phosphomannomutase, C-terminal domain family [Gloeomargarita lithophora Alchichica-D10]|uniref:Phosphoglucomutase/phosphomannomutase, C-terminal domain family n=1 Tax=Gloeomargarita lithophora Alchichica-D10 TaxID=1188229 RepID=A0A1J0ADS6_9CYAN|nr:phosphoglucomutase/phosphomannomutase family protein [Gloeomargarita lithophora]APB34064.1 Phosphoglucomutase/phosphomannomutase, C-terminal domain family [Gloeomargarita lithophora Alchichica-D10]